MLFASNLDFCWFKFDEIYAQNLANQILKFDFGRYTVQK